MKERHRPIELDVELAKAYATTFIPRRDIYPIQRENGRYIQVKKQLSDDLIVAHLTCHHTQSDTVTLGAYALSPKHKAQWICLDADTDEQWIGVWRLAHQLHQQGITTYPEPSRRGGHLWLFTPIISGTDARTFGKQLLALHGLAEAKIELYPKQARLKQGAGSFVRLPLGVHRKANKVFPFVNLKGEPLAPTLREQIAILANPTRVPQTYINTVLDTLPQTPKAANPNKAKQIVTGQTLSETLKSSISVLDFVSQFVQLDNHGKGLCPFHDDQVSSFQVNVEKNYWHCYAGCGGGSLIDFWMKWRERQGEDNSFTSTVKDLRERLL